MLLERSRFLGSKIPSQLLEVFLSYEGQASIFSMGSQVSFSFEPSRPAIKEILTKWCFCWQPIRAMPSVIAIRFSVRLNRGVCVCTALDQERRGSLPNTCCCNFKCEFSSRGHLGHEEVRRQRRHLFIACEISSGRRADVPAKTNPVWQIRKTAPVREIRRPTMP